MAIINSYDLTNKQEQVFNAFEDLRQKYPSILGLIKIGAKPTDTKHIWLERQLTESTTTISTAPSPATSGTTVTLASVTNVAVGDNLWFTKSTGAEVSEVVYVSAVNTGTGQCTISRSYGSSTAASLAIGDIAHVIKPTKQGWLSTDLSSVSGTAPTEYYNYVQSITRLVQIAKLAELSLTYGVTGGRTAEHLADQIEQQSQDMFREMTSILNNSYRVAPANTTTAKGSAGGFKTFITGGIEITTGGVITLDHFHDAIEDLYESGANPGTRYLAYASTGQSRRISALNTSGTNPQVIINQDSNMVGYGAGEWIKGDISGTALKVLTDFGIATDVIYLLDLDRISINYMTPFEIQDDPLANPSVASGAIGKILSAAFTFEIKNGTTAHAKISGLTV